MILWTTYIISLCTLKKKTYFHAVRRLYSVVLYLVWKVFDRKEMRSRFRSSYFFVCVLHAEPLGKHRVGGKGKSGGGILEYCIKALSWRSCCICVASSPREEKYLPRQLGQSVHYIGSWEGGGKRRGWLRNSSRWIRWKAVEEKVILRSCENTKIMGLFKRQW